MTPYLTCNDTELTLHHPLGLLPMGMRRMVETWLREHDINPITVAPRAAVRRDPATGAVSWLAETPDGTRVRAVHRTSRPGSPAPFPPMLRTDTSGSDAHLVRSS